MYSLLCVCGIINSFLWYFIDNSINDAKKSKIMEVVYYMYMNWKKELRSKSAHISVCTFKDNKILTVDRNDMFISEIIGTFDM
jgi:phage baseplate assembly protein W